MSRETESPSFEPYAIVLLEDGTNTRIPFSIDEVLFHDSESVFNNTGLQFEQDVDIIIDINLPEGAEVVKYVYLTSHNT